MTLEGDFKNEMPAYNLTGVALQIARCAYRLGLRKADTIVNNTLRARFGSQVQNKYAQSIGAAIKREIDIVFE